jgi:hypothetical protein
MTERVMIMRYISKVSMTERVMIMRYISTPFISNCLARVPCIITRHVTENRF